MHILMILANAFRPDPRVAREATALVRAGHRVTVLCWDRRAELPARSDHEGVEIRRLHSVRSAYGSGWRQLFYLPRFWREAVRQGVALAPDAVHCHDLDTLVAGTRLKRRLGCKLVYDAHEDYPAMMSLYLPGSLVRGLSWLERRLQGRADETITASTVFADKLRARGVKRVTTIGNYQPLEPFAAIDAAAIARARAELGLGPGDFMVAYIGGLSRNRSLLPFIEAARGLAGVTALIWGEGHQRAAVEAAVEGADNLRFLGWLPAERVPLLTSAADCIYYCLRPDYPGAEFNAPNTLSNAMAAGRPIIANDVGDLGRIVRETGCGLLLPAVDAQAIRRAIDELRDPARRLQMGSAGRAAAEAVYNWGAAETELRGIYQRLGAGPMHE